MVIEFLDLNDPNLKPFDGVNFALIGFKSDKGVISTTAEWGLSNGHKLSEPSWPSFLGIWAETSASLMLAILTVLTALWSSCSKAWLEQSNACESLISGLLS